MFRWYLLSSGEIPRIIECYAQENKDHPSRATRLSTAQIAQVFNRGCGMFELMVEKEETKT